MNLFEQSDCSWLRDKFLNYIRCMHGMHVTHLRQGRGWRDIIDVVNMRMCVLGQSLRRHILGELVWLMRACVPVLGVLIRLRLVWSVGVGMAHVLHWLVAGLLRLRCFGAGDARWLGRRTAWRLKLCGGYDCAGR